MTDYIALMHEEDQFMYYDGLLFQKYILLAWAFFTKRGSIVYALRCHTQNFFGMPVHTSAVYLSETGVPLPWPGPCQGNV